MMRHLSRDVLLHVAETGELHPHAARCTRCRDAIEELRAAIAEARGASVPEPSPLFWDHLSSRVREAVERSETRTTRVRALVFGGRMLPRVAVAAAAVFLLVAGVWRIESARRVRQVACARLPVAVQAADNAGGAPSDASETLDDDVSWELVTDVAANVDLDGATDAAAVSLQPGAAERAALQLSADEQRELVRLLQAAVEQPE